MTSKPYDVYTNAQVALLTATGIESQWFERKAHPPDRAPTGLREFVQHIAETICGFANNNPEVGGLFVVGVADNGEVHGVDRLGTDYTNRILGYAELLDGPTPEHKIVEATRADGAGDHIVLIYTSFLPN